MRKVQIRVFEDRVRRTIVCEAALTLWDDGNVSGVNRRCQQIMRSRFAELMPDETAVQVHLTVHRLSHRRPDSEPAPAVREQRRATAETADEGAADDRTPTQVPLPGLTATHGEVDNEAGAELLRAGRERRGTTALVVEGEAPAPESGGAASAEAVAEAEAEAAEQEEQFDDLYVGPNYPVDDDEDESGIQARG